MTAVHAPHPFTIANYRAYWVTRLTAMLALYSMMLIIGWQAYNLARDSGLGIGASSIRLGLIGLAQFLPLFALTPLVGWIADVMDRRLVTRIVLAVQALVAALLAWLTANDAMSLPVLYGIAMVLGVCRAFLGPALGALAPNLVPKQSLPTAIALSSIAWQAGMLVGPAMAGSLFRVDPALPYTVSAVLYAIAVIAMLMIGPVPRNVPDRASGPIAQVTEGLHYIWRNRLVMGAITLDLFAVLLAGAVALIPVFARDILQLNGAEAEHALSLLAASPAAGAGFIALIFSVRPIRHNVGNKMLTSVVIFGLASIGFGLSKWLPLSMACLFVYGAADMFSVYIRQSLIQLHTPDDKRGRVGAVAQLTVSASNELGEAESGFLAGLIGPVAAVVAGGVGAIVITLIWARRFPELGAAKTFDPPEEVLAYEAARRQAGDL